MLAKPCSRCLWSRTMRANLQSLRGLQLPFELGVPRIRFLGASRTQTINRHNPARAKTHAQPGNSLIWIACSQHENLLQFPTWLMAGQAASRDFDGLLHVFFTPAVGPLSDSQPAWVCRSVNHALQIRPGMEAVFRCELDGRPPASASVGWRGRYSDGRWCFEAGFGR